MAKNTVIVSILGDTRGLNKSLGSAGKSLSGLGKLAKGAVTTVAAVGGALVGLAAAGGFARALKMDEARTQLAALGYSAGQVTGIMDSALKSVKGTAFGLDQAAVIAANALASGVPQGERLTKALTTVANTAALAKTDMSDMGGIFQKVWANGKVTTMEMNQLADRGVPIWQYLSKAFGVSNAELRKMIESGNVTADMFESALSPAVDGMATKMGDSFKGMLANARAALSRIGALFAAPLLSAAKPALGEFTKLVDAAGETFKPFADKFEAALGNLPIEGIADRIMTAFSKLQGLSPAEIVIRLVTDLANGISSSGPKIEAGITKMVQGLANAITTGIPVIVQAIVTLLTALIDVLPDIIGSLVTALTDALTKVVAALTKALPTLLTALVAALIGAIPVLLDAAVTLLTALVQAIPLILPPLLDGLVDLVLQLVPLLANMFPVLLDAAVNMLTALIDALPVILPKLIAGLIGLIPVLALNLVNQTIVILTAAIKLFTALISALPLILPNLIIEIIKMLPQIVTAIGSMFPLIFTSAVKLFMALVTAIPSIAGKLGPELAKLGPKMVDAVNAMIPQLLAAGRNLVDGLARGLAANAGAVKDKLLGIAKGAINAFKSFFGIHSPSKLMAQMGGFLTSGLGGGIDKGISTVRRAVAKLNTAVTDTFSPTLDTPGVTVTPGTNATVTPGTPGTSAGARVYNITVQALSSSYEVGKAVVDAIREYERINGGQVAGGAA